MSRADEITQAARLVEDAVNRHLAAGGSSIDLSLAMMAASAELLKRHWDAPRVLSAFDVLVEGAVSR